MKGRGKTYADLRSEFRSGAFKPLYFLYGEEPFFMDELYRELHSCALQPHERDFNCDVVYGPETDATAVLGLCSAYPMMAARRVVVVRSFELLKENAGFARYAKEPNPTAVVLLIYNGRPRLGAEPYRSLNRLAVSAEFRPLYDNEVPAFVAARLQDAGCRAPQEVAQMLVDFVGTSLHSVANEIEKLLTYLGERRDLTPEDVIQASGQTRAFNVFELQRALGEGRREDVHLIGERILAGASNRRGEALRMVYVLHGFVAKLWKLHGSRGARRTSRELAAHIGVSPFVLRQYQVALRRTSAPALEQAFASLLAADYELKGGSRREEGLVITLLLRRLLGSFDC